MNAKSTLLRGARALLGDAQTYDPRPLDVLVADGRIAAIEPAGMLTTADSVIELTGRLLVPGLVNGHQHSHEHFQRGRTENLPLELWQHLVRTRVPVTLTPRQVYLRTLIGAIESLRTGCTTLVDDMALGPAVDRERIDASLQAYEDAGIRALVGLSLHVVGRVGLLRVLWERSLRDNGGQGVHLGVPHRRPHAQPGPAQRPARHGPHAA
jgi:guanine deaminase